ncbi:MAG: DUF2207 domain-containing protein [Planctomycetes bacterium]|nr:DUF2207 domain-containing protein [Planctomycetota bacterium]
MRTRCLFAAFVAASSLVHAGEEADPGYSIESFAIRIVVGEDGSLDVSEEMDVDFHEDSPAFLRIVNASDLGGGAGARTRDPGQGTRVRILSVEDFGGIARLHEVHGDPDAPAVWIGERGRPVRGRQTYRITYRIEGVVPPGGGERGLRWKLPLDVAIAGPRRASVEVELPSSARLARLSPIGVRWIPKERADSRRFRAECGGPFMPFESSGIDLAWEEPAPGGGQRSSSFSAFLSCVALLLRELAPVLLPWFLVELVFFLWRRNYAARHLLDKPIPATGAPENLGAFEIGLVRFGPRLALRPDRRLPRPLRGVGELGFQLLVGQIVGLAVKGFLVLRELGRGRFEFLAGPRYLVRAGLAEHDRFLLDRILPSGLSTRLAPGAAGFWRAVASAFARRVAESMEAHGIVARGTALVQLLRGLWSLRVFASVLVASRAAGLSVAYALFIFFPFYLAGLWLRSRFDKSRWLRPRGAVLHRAVKGYEIVLCSPLSRHEGLVLAQRAWEERLAHAIALGRHEEWAEAIAEAGWNGRVDWLVTEEGEACPLGRVLERVEAIERAFSAICFGSEATSWWGLWSKGRVRAA